MARSEWDLEPTTSFLDFSRLEHAQDTHEHREQQRLN